MSRSQGELTRGGLRWSATIAIVVVAAVGVAALLGWRVVAAEARGHVSVSWNGPVTCEGTTVRSVPSPYRDGTMSVVATREGMRCTVPVRVANGSRVAVTVAKVRLPFMGPEGGVPVQVRRLEGREPSKPRAVDAVFRLGEVVQPGETYDLDVVLEFRAPPQGCSSPRSTTSYRMFPLVTVQALGRPGVVGPERALGLLGTRDSDCSRDR